MKKNKTFYQNIPETEQKLIWKDKKRPFFGLPLSFTTYSLFEDRLLIQKGLLLRQEDEIRLYRILDLRLRQSLTQRLFGVGSVVLYSGDAVSPCFVLHHIQQPQKVFQTLSNLAEAERERRVGMFESFPG